MTDGYNMTLVKWNKVIQIFINRLRYYTVSLYQGEEIKFFKYRYFDVFFKRRDKRILQTGLSILVFTTRNQILVKSYRRASPHQHLCKGAVWTLRHHTMTCFNLTISGKCVIQNLSTFSVDQLSINIWMVLHICNFFPALSNIDLTFVGFIDILILFWSRQFALV